MNKILMLLAVLLPIALWCTAPEITNVTATQRDDGSRKVDINYNVYDADGDAMTIVMNVSDDDGATWNLSCNLVTGDIGPGIYSGNGKHIVWDVLAEHPNMSGDDFRFKIVADDGQTPVPDGFVYVPSGSFQMGRTDVATPIHTVNLDAFYIGTYEVTQQEWVDVMGSNPSYFTGDMQRPVERVSWYSVVKYCNYSSIQEGLTPVYSVSGDTNPDNWGGSFTPDVNWSANGYRLPTEAEWEYSARGATNTPDYLYSGSDTIDDVAWYYDNSDTGSGRQPHPVGQKQANGIGTYDQSGNVWEWCWDWYGSYTSGTQTNPHGPATGSYRRMRGGCWYDYAWGCEVAIRHLYTPSNGYYFIGFRLCRTAE